MTTFAPVKFYSTVSDNIDALPIVNGQLIFVRDTRTIYMDHDEGRISYSQVIFVNQEENMLNLKNPAIGFYFSGDSNVFWRYDGNEWIRLTEHPREQVMFVDKLPTVGKPHIIYVCGYDMYKYSDDDECFVNLTGSYWTEIG